MANTTKAIMRRIYFIWFARKVLSPLALKLVAISALVWKFTAYVSVQDVLVNAPLKEGGMSTSLHFFESAFVNTESVTVMLLGAIALLAAFLVRDMFIKRHTAPRRAYAQI